MRLWPLLLVLAFPTASGCSLAYFPYQDARWDDGLWYVDGADLRHATPPSDDVFTSGWFLSYARADDHMLVAGQEGLGADCSGQGWLRLHQGEEVVWEETGSARVWPHVDGLIVQHDGDLLRLDGDALVPMDVAVEEAYILGWTPDSRPVYRHAGDVVVGDLLLSGDWSGSEPAVATSPSATGVFVQTEGKALLHIVDGPEVPTVAWAADPDAIDLVWTDTWHALAGGRAFRIVDGEVTDLGLDAIAIGTRGEQTLVFTEDGYTVFDAGRPVEAARRVQDSWLPAPAQATPKPVSATEGRVSAAPENGTSDGTGTQDTPMLGGAVLGVAILGFALLRCGRRT